MKIMEKAFQGITMPQFYKYGSVLFVAGIIGASINAKMQWGIANIGSKISLVSSTLFQCLLLTLFITLYFQVTKTMPEAPKIIESPEVENFLKELNNSEKEVNQNE